MYKSQSVIVTPSKNGRYAVLVRDPDTQQWTQVESIIDEDSADQYAEDIDHYESGISDVLDGNSDPDWGSDSPVTWPES